MGRYTFDNLYNRIINIKAHKDELKIVLSKWGINVPANTMLDSYPTYINQLEIHPDFMLEYIEQPGYESGSRCNVYFTTGYDITTTTKVEIKASAQVNNTNHEQILIGCTSTTFFIEMPAKTGISYAASVGNSLINVAGSDLVADEPHILTAWHEEAVGHFIVDGVDHTQSCTATYPTTGTELYLFARKDGTTGNPMTHCYGGTRIYYTKIWDNNNLVRFYIPVLHWDGSKYVPCFYDKVSGTYLYASGNATEIARIQYKRRPDILLDYIANGEGTTSSTKNVFFNTTVSPNINNRFDFKYSVPIKSVTGTVMSVNGGNASSYSDFLSPAGNTALAFQNRQSSTTDSVIVSYSGKLIIDTPHTVSAYTPSGSTTLIYDGILFTKTTSLADGERFPTVGHYTFFARHNESTDAYSVNAYDGTKIYYMNFTNSNNPVSSFIPVIHNAKPCFYDIINEKYIYNVGTDTPVYRKLHNDDILCSYIGNCAFRINHAPTINSKIEIKAEPISESAGLLFGSINTSYQGYQLIFNDSSKIVYYCGPANNTYKVIGPERTINTPYIVTAYQDATKGYLVVNGTTYSSTKSADITGLTNLVLGGRVVGTTVNYSQAAYYKYYYMKIWEDNNLVHLYIPVLHWNGTSYVPCLYDKVTGDYLYNQTSNVPTYAVNNDILLDYISNGIDGSPAENTNYVDTGVMPNNIAFRLDTKAAVYNETTQQWPLGEINTGSWNGFTLYMGYTASGSGPTYARVNSVNVTNGNLPYASNTPVTFSSFLDLNDKNSSNQYKAYSYIDNIKYNGGTGTAGYTGNMGGAQNIYLFTRHRHNGAPTVVPGGAKLYYVVMTTADVPNKTLIPVLHNGEACFYDIVNDNYLHAAYPYMLAYNKL